MIFKYEFKTQDEKLIILEQNKDLYLLEENYFNSGINELIFSTTEAINNINLNEKLKYQEVRIYTLEKEAADNLLNRAITDFKLDNLQVNSINRLPLIESDYWFHKVKEYVSHYNEEQLNIFLLTNKITQEEFNELKTLLVK